MDFKGRIKKKRITKMPAEFKILERAEMYLRKLSCGVNPLTEENLSENDACKQERISKCLLYVADYIQQKIAPKNEKQAAQKPQKKLQPRRERELATAELVLNDESLAKFEYSEEPISVSGIVRKVNDLIPAGSGIRQYSNIKLSDDSASDLDEKMKEIYDLRVQEQKMLEEERAAAPIVDSVVDEE